MGISDNYPSSSQPYFLEQGGVAPSQLEDTSSLQSLVESFVRSHGEQITGVLHIEAKVDGERRAQLIEVNCRPGSAETYTMVKTVWGVDLALAVI